MKKTFLLVHGLCFVTCFLLASRCESQISAKLMRYLDVSASQITFVYGGDIWVMPKGGGQAVQVTHSPGEESWPRFSPDGKLIGYTASYNGNEDIYVMPTLGGLPTRVTYDSHADRMVDWHPGGEKILFASGRNSAARQPRKFFLVSKDGGMAERLNVPYGELASYSPDGNSLAYITKITENYPFKRYRGGLASDVLIYDLLTDTAKNITNNEGNDGKPAWSGEKIYFLSDQDENMRLNIWVYDTKTEVSEQITRFENFDISFFSVGDRDLVFEAGGSLYLMTLETGEYDPVVVNVVSDLSAEMATTKDVSRQIANVTSSPEGKRVVFEARGELFNVPSKEGYVINMTRSSGAFDHSPSWSPDGKHIAYWSDRGGEYEIYLQSNDTSEEPRKLSTRGKGFGYSLHWAPDGSRLAFIDETNTIFIIAVETGESVRVDNTVWNVGHGGRFRYSIAWSPDSKWLSFEKRMDNGNSAIVLYELESGEAHQASSGYFSDSSPVFSDDGKYLFYLTSRSLRAVYSDLDGTWVYPNSTQIAALSLGQETPSLLATKNDEITVAEDKEIAEGEDGDSDGKEEKDGDEKKEGEKNGGEEKAEGKKGNEKKTDNVAKEETEGKESGEGEKKEKTKDAKVAVEIDFDDLEARLELLPVAAGNLGGLIPFDGKLVYSRRPVSGTQGGSASLVYYDFKKRKEETILADVSFVSTTGNGKSLLVGSKGKYGVVKAAKGQKIEKPIPTNGLVMNLVPREEWRQIFHDTWRRHRDFFYDPAMHQLDWDELRERYGALIDEARTRWDVGAIQLNLAAELSAGHTYASGGDTERVPRLVTGFLGIDWELEDQQYRIKRIVRPAPWDTEVRSPFDRPGVDVKAGDFILSVNGIRVDPTKDAYAAFEGLSGKTVSLVVSRSGKREDAVSHTIKLLTQREEDTLRALEWIENNRKRVDELSGGKLGYVYMSNTGSRGQLELVRMYYGQLAKKGFVIDERFNGGGQLADRFLELLQRPVVYNLHWRHGKDHTHPVKTNTGPVGMLINGWAGSGGDGLPWAFQELKAGPIVGERTLGILVGPATGHRLIDGGRITVPGARLYDNDGHWFWEGEGVSPDIEVWDDPAVLAKGRDPQIERVVEEVLKMLQEWPTEMTPAPAPEDRTASGLTRRAGDD